MGGQTHTDTATVVSEYGEKQTDTKDVEGGGGEDKQKRKTSKSGYLKWARSGFVRRNGIVHSFPQLYRGWEGVGYKQQEKKDSQRTEHNNDIKPNMDGREGQSQTRAHKLRRGKNRKHATSNAKQPERERESEREWDRKKEK